MDKTNKKPESEKPMSNEEFIKQLKMILGQNQPPKQESKPILEQEPKQIYSPSEDLQNEIQLPPQPKLTREQEKFVMAKMTLKLHKKIILLSLMLIIIPLSISLIAVMDPMIAMIVAMFALIYPAYSYVQSNKAQFYLSNKYRLRPFTPFNPPKVRQKKQEDYFF